VLKTDTDATVLAQELLRHVSEGGPASEIPELVARRAAGPLDPETGRRLLSALAQGELEQEHWRVLDGAAVERLFTQEPRR
jgi:hypothetical protein